MFMENFFRCTSCGKTYPLESKIWRCTCNSYLGFHSKPVGYAPVIRNKETSFLRRYTDFYPYLNSNDIVGFHEGYTPLDRLNYKGHDLFMKLEHLLPGGSFKDRGAALLISMLKRNGIEEIIEDSSGNAGTSIAAFAVRAGIQCKILVPAHTSKSKCDQIRALGADLIQVPGNREVSARAALALSEKYYYASHVWNPLFIEGIKSIVFEFFEQCGGLIPPVWILPLGNGTLTLGIYKGLQQLLEMKMIEQMPVIHAVQHREICPVYDLFHQKTKVQQREISRPLLSPGIAVSDPLRKREIVDALRKTGGSVFCVDDRDIISGLKTLLSFGYFPEPTSAVAFSAFEKHFPDAKPHSIAMIITGNGLKSMDMINTILND
jgi:threonine synthase